MKIRLTKLVWIVVIFLVLGSSVAVFYKWQESILQLRSAQKELGSLKEKQQKLEMDIQRLETEKESLKAEVGSLDKEKCDFQAKFEDTQKQLSKLQADFAAANEKVASLEKMNAGLIKDKEAITSKFELSESRRKELEEKFHSVKELKKAMGEIKKDIREYNRRHKLIRRTIQQNKDRLRTLHGNGGYTTRDFRTTYNLWKSQVNIEVFSAD